MRGVTSWKDGGRDEFLSFAGDSQPSTSDACGSGTKAFAWALLWKDVFAKHAYIVFLGGDGADGDDDFDAVGGGGSGGGGSG